MLLLPLAADGNAAPAPRSVYSAAQPTEASVKTLGEQRSWAMSEAQTTCETGRPSWDVTPSGFETTMSITATVTVGGAPAMGTDNVLAAFVDGEVRGVATPVPVGTQMVYFLTAYANGSSDTLSFRLYEAATDLVRIAAVELSFVPNAVEGAPSSPFRIDVGCATASTSREAVQDKPTHVTLHPPYPNPFADEVTFSYELRQPGPVRLALYDLIGRELEVLVDGIKTRGQHTVTTQLDAALPPGVLVYRLRYGNQVASGAVIRGH